MTTFPPTPISSLDFFASLVWLDGRPLLDTVEPYRQDIFSRALDGLRADGSATYNMVLAGRGKKNWKTADLVLAALYVLVIRQSPQGNDCLILANDAGQAADDLELAKKLVRCNRVLDAELEIQALEIRRRDGKGAMKILPAKDAAGAHGKTAAFVGFDEIHGYRDWNIMEGLQPDPTRVDALTWITSYDSFYQSPGCPLFDLKRIGIAGEDPRMLFSWYSADLCTDPAFADLPPEQKANPSMRGWPDPDYLEQQRRRLPTHKYRRLHLNLPGAPAGAFLDPQAVADAIVIGRRTLPPMRDTYYYGFVDMSGGSNDDAVLAIAHQEDGKIVVDLVEKQASEPPFNPRDAVKKFVNLLDDYGCKRVCGDKYAGMTFQADFSMYGISYITSELNKSELYEAMEPEINAGVVELPNLPKLEQQLLGLIFRGSRVDHANGEHDDWANAAAGAVWCVKNAAAREVGVGVGAGLGQIQWLDQRGRNPLSAEYNRCVGTYRADGSVKRLHDPDSIVGFFIS
jgi:hypothetical protein